MLYVDLPEQALLEQLHLWPRQAGHPADNIQGAKLNRTLAAVALKPHRLRDLVQNTGLPSWIDMDMSLQI